jgi:hypothetical protein
VSTPNQPTPEQGRSETQPPIGQSQPVYPQTASTPSQPGQPYEPVLSPDESRPATDDPRLGTNGDTVDNDTRVTRADDNNTGLTRAVDTDTDGRSTGSTRAVSNESATGAESANVAAVPIGNGNTIRENAYAREKEEFGGIKFGSGFFGWLTALGLGIVLMAIVAGTGVVVSLGTGTSAEEATNQVQEAPEALGLVGIISVLVILFIAYFAGGYVAGRMARFSGAKQGLAVWIWAIVVAVILAIVAAIAGEDYNILANLNVFPRIPINEGTLTTTAIITAVLAAIVPLLAAILGGTTGMRYHRKVDRVGLGR